jgi:aspartyl-tRNA(Asn)/glutamyl-tRNA(Gln) amidotransferase subunit B
MIGGLLNAEGIGIATLAGTRMAPERLAEVLLPRLQGEINEPAARRLFEAALERTDPIADLIETMDIRQLSDEETLLEIVGRVLASGPQEVERYRAGEHKLLEHFMGQIMRETRGRANPRLADKLLRRELER